MNIFTFWWLAIRPKTLSISISPVLLGSALAWYDCAKFSLLTFFVILFSALCIQVATNLYNDAADFEKGADKKERLGPKRAAQQGWLTVQQIKQGALISFILAFLAGIYLVWLGGLIVVILGLFSIFFGYAYTAGPKPIAYSPFGELFVLLFFGFVAVGGTYYLQSQTFNNSVILMASGIGCLAAAILLVNNYRDLEGDQQVDKLTLVYYLGRPKALILYSMLLAYPYLLLTVFITDYSWFILLPLLSLPMAIKLIQFFMSLGISCELNQVLIRTAQLQLVYTFLLSFALLLQ